MRRWQRLARAGIGLFAVGFAVVVYLAIKQRGPVAPASSVPRIDPTAIAESTGGVSQLAKGTRQDYAIEYGRALTYADGTSKFSEGITVRVPQRSGRDFTLKARQAEVRDQQSTMAVDGDVQLLSSDGLDIRAASATFNNGEGIVRVPGAVSFTRARMTGRSRGATFDRGRDVLWLLEDARVSIAPEEDGSGATDVSAGTAGFARRDRYLRFERDVNIGRSGQRVMADTAMMFLAPDADVVQMIELRGNSSVTPEAGSATTLRAMSARDINMHYSLDGRALQRVVLAGTASVEFGATAGAQGRTLSAEWVEMLFAEDGQSITSLVGRDNVQLQFPVEHGGPARRIRAVSLEAVGEAGKGITTAHFVEQVNFRETRLAAGGEAGYDREIRSQTLVAVVTPGMGEIEAANFGGGVRFVDDPTNASAPELQYNVAQGTAKLVASTGGAGCDRHRRRDHDRGAHDRPDARWEGARRRPGRPQRAEGHAGAAARRRGRGSEAPGHAEGRSARQRDVDAPGLRHVDASRDLLRRGAALAGRDRGAGRHHRPRRSGGEPDRQRQRAISVAAGRYRPEDQAGRDQDDPRHGGRHGL